MSRTGGFARGVLLVAAIVILAPAPAQAQYRSNPVAGTPEFKQLLEGRPVILTTFDDIEFEGVVRAVSATGVVFDRKVSASEIPFGRIRKIEKPSYRLRKGTLIGLTVGVGLGLKEAIGSCEGSECRAYFVLGTAFGTGMGAFFDGMSHLKRGNKDIIYIGRKSSTTTFALSPIVTPARKGAVLSISWR